MNIWWNKLVVWGVWTERRVYFGDIRKRERERRERNKYGGRETDPDESDIVGWGLSQDSGVVIGIMKYEK